MSDEVEYCAESLEPAELALLRTAISKSERQQVIAGFLVTYACDLTQIARSCRKWERVTMLGFDDIEQIVRETAYLMMSAVGTDDEKIATGRWMGLLTLTARARVRDFAQSGAVAPATGMSAVARRAASLQQVRHQLRSELHREPADSEVIVEHDRRKSETVADPARHGTLAAGQVNELPTFSSDPLDFVPIEDNYYGGDSDSYILHPAESTNFLKELLTLAAEQDEDLGVVAEVWITQSILAGGDSAPVAMIAEQIDKTYDQVRAAITKIKSLALELLAARGVFRADELD